MAELKRIPATPTMARYAQQALNTFEYKIIVTRYKIQVASVDSNKHVSCIAA